MFLKERQTDPELSTLLADFAKRGGVVDYALFDLIASPSTSYELHREAAILALSIFGRRGGWSRLSVEEEKASGHEITSLEFLGPCFDANTHRLTGTDSRNHGEYFILGYADAFSDPPHLLESTWEKTNTLFLALNSYLFDNFQHEHEIYAWSTDWSNYFDGGKEWWGGFPLDILQ